MTLEQFTAVTIGMTLNALTFVLGVLVGCSLKRKEAFNGYCNTKKDRRHHAAVIRPYDRSIDGQPGGAKPGTKAHPDERASG